LAGLIFQFNQIQLRVLVLEQWLCACKLQLPFKFLFCLKLVYLRVEYSVEAINVLSRLNLLYLSLAVLIYFKKLIYLLVKSVQYSLHFDFAFF